MSGTSNSTADKLLAAAGGDADLARELATLFITELERLLAEARAAAARGDGINLRKILHMLRGSAGTLGFGGVADAALAVELRVPGAASVATDLAEELARLSAACDAADRETQAYLRQ